MLVPDARIFFKRLGFAEQRCFPMLEDLIQCHKALMLVKSKGLPKLVMAGGLKKAP